MSQPIVNTISWRHPDLEIIDPEERLEIQERRKRVEYRDPPLMGVEEWAKDLNSGQLITAYYDYFEKWTWDSGTEIDGEVFRALEQELSYRDNEGPIEEGDAYYSTKDDCAYIYDGDKWLQLTTKVESLV